MSEYQQGVFKCSWRSSSFPKLEQADGLTDVYEFGVFGGNSMIELSHIMYNSQVNVRKLVGFDSFDGIPKETAEASQDIWDPEASPFFSAFNIKKVFGVEDPLDAVEMVRVFVEREMVGDQELVLVPGFFEDSLDHRLVRTHDLGKAILVDMDADIYTSTIQALSWLFDNSLVDSGTYFAYDDWGGTPGYKQGLDGESRAHREISEQYGCEWELIATNTDHVPDSQVVFRLR